jgi:hypothetical protein
MDEVAFWSRAVKKDFLRRELRKVIGLTVKLSG